MSIISIRAALETKLSSITPAYNFDTYFENTPLTPTNGIPYQEAYLMPAETDNVTMGDDHKRENGVFQVSLFYPLQEGAGMAAERAEVIKAAFKRGASFTAGSVTVRISKTPFIGKGRVDGDRWMVPVKIQYFADIF